MIHQRFERVDEAAIHIPTADVSHVRRKWLDIPYAGTSQAQKLDLYLPEEGDGPFPVIVHIHGGGFAIGDKRDIHLLPLLHGLDRGYAVASVNYRLSGEAIFPAGLHDVKAAIRWLRANDKEYHLDGTRFVAWGGSAGGYYTAMVCLTSNIPEMEDLSLGNRDVPSSVQAGVDWFGPTDFGQMDAQFAESGLGRPDHGAAQSPESRLLGAPLAEIPDRVQWASPLNYVHPDAPPILIQHGRIDPLVPVQQSMILAQKLEEAAGDGRGGCGCKLIVLENAGHGDPLFETEENLEQVFSFLAATLYQCGQNARNR